jgi:hypothetical protein
MAPAEGAATALIVVAFAATDTAQHLRVGKIRRTPSGDWPSSVSMCG